MVDVLLGVVVYGEENRWRSSACIENKTSFDEVTATVFLIDAHTKTFPVVLFSYIARGTTDGTIAAASSFMLLFVLGIVFVLTRYVGMARALGVLDES